MTNGSGDEEVGRRYRYRQPRIFPGLGITLRTQARGIAPGNWIGPFALLTTDRAPLRSGDVFKGGRPTLFVFGSLTCAATESSISGLKMLHEIYGSRVRFVLVNVREAQPGKRLPQPQTFDEKWHRSIALKIRHNLPFEVAVDKIDGTFHRMLGADPNSAFVIDHRGTILFRTKYSNDTAAIGDALLAVANGRRPHKLVVGNTFKSTTKMVGYMNSVFSAAGGGAALHACKLAPHLTALMLLSGLFKFLPKESRGFPAVMLLISLLLLAFCVALFSGGTTSI